jgi:hypothetical protein
VQSVRRWFRSFLRSTPGRTLVVVLLLYAGYQVWIGAQAAGKVDPAVYEQADEDGDLAIRVRLDFPPERFHILEIQKFGRIRRVEGTTVEVHSVLPEGVGSLARRYWISRIEPLTQDGEAGT